jgi:hypothetical protein
MIFDAIKCGLLGLVGVFGILNLQGQQVEVPGK